MSISKDPQLTLSSVAAAPEIATYEIWSGNAVFRLRPLDEDDVGRLSKFLSTLSEQTRKFSIFSDYGEVGAKEMCDAINRFDKFRLVLEDVRDSVQRPIAGFVEFSFDHPDNEVARFVGYGESLVKETDCRFGITIADKYQDIGIGQLIFPSIREIAERFGQKRIILWGGVLAENARAIHYYERIGFRHVGEFTSNDGHASIDMVLELPSPHQL